MKKLIKTLFIIGIALSTFFITFSAIQPLEVYAEGNGEGEDDGTNLKRKDGEGYGGQGFTAE